jgi:putative chitinase
VQSAAYNDGQSDQTPLYLNGLARARRWTLTSGGLSLRQATERLPANKRLGFILSEADRPALLDFSNGAISFVDALLGRLDILAANEINNADRAAFFLGSLAHETGAFHSQIERFKYSPAGLMKNWPRAFPTLQIADLYFGKPEASANRAYALTNGNGDESSGDGWRYRGRGLFMLTRKNWYRHFSNAKIDLLADPELVNDPQIGLDVAARLWRERGANELADQRDLDRIMARMWFREHVKERYWWIRRAYAAINAKIPDGIGVSGNRAA